MNIFKLVLSFFTMFTSISTSYCFAADDEVSDSNPSNLPAIIVQVNQSVTTSGLLDEISSALLTAREENKRSDAEKRRLILSLKRLVASKHLFSDFHLRLFATALDELGTSISTKEAKQDLGKAIVAQMRLILVNAANQGIIPDGLSGRGDIDLIDSISAKPELFEDYLELLEDTYSQEVLNIRRLLVATGQTVNKSKFTGKELIDFSKLSLTVLNSMIKNHLNAESNGNEILPVNAIENGERNYVELIPDGAGAALILVSGVSGVIGLFYGGFQFVDYGNSIPLYSITSTATGVGVWGFSASHVLVNSQAKRMQAASLVGAIAGLSVPFLVGTELPVLGSIQTPYEALLTGAALTLPVVYSRDIINKVFGGSKFFFPNVRKGLLRIWAGRDYNKLISRMSKSSLENMTHLISSDGEIESTKSVEDFLKKANLKKTIVEPQHASLIEKIRMEVSVGGITFDSFNEIQNAFMSYIFNEGRHQVLLSSGLSKALSEIFESYYRWKSEPTELNGDILIEKVLGANEQLSRIANELEGSMNRSAAMKTKIKDYYERIVQDLNSDEIAADDRSALEIGARAFYEIERFGSLNMQFLTYQAILGEVRALMSKTFLSLSEPINLQMSQQSMRVLNVAEIEKDAKQSALSDWNKLSVAQLFQSLDPRAFMTSLFSQVEDRLNQLKEESEPLLIEQKSLSCKSLLIK